METIRILAKKAFQFDHPVNAEQPHRVDMQSMTDVPEWVKDSAMFKLAYQAGEVIVIENKQDEAKAELEVVDNKGGKGKVKTTTDDPKTQP